MAKHLRTFRYPRHVDADPIPEAICTKAPGCPRCHPFWYALVNARHRRDRP